MEKTTNDIGSLAFLVDTTRYKERIYKIEQKTTNEVFSTVAYLEGLRISDPIAAIEMNRVIELEKQREEYERAEIETAQSIQHAGGESR